MLVRLRTLALSLVAAAVLLTPGTALAGCATTPTAPSCLPSAPPTPRVTPIPPSTPTPQPATAKPSTPTPSKSKTKDSTTTAASEPARDAAVVVEDTPLPEPTPTVEILVTTPVPEETDRPIAARPAGDSSPASWAWLLVGLLVGALVGRASWGLTNRRKRQQQIFG